MAKRCEKGNSCGATCIHADDKCLQELPPQISEGLTSVSKMLSVRVDEGSLTDQEAEEVVSQIKGLSGSQLKAYSEFNSLVKSGEVTDAEKEQVANLIVSTLLVRGQDKKAVRLMSFDEIESVLKPGRLESLENAYNESFTPDGKFDPSLKGAMGDLVQSRLVVPVSDRVANVAYNMLPSTARSKLDRMGKPPEGRTYGGDDSEGNPIFVEGGNKVRGVFLTKRFMEQGGLDPYTGKRIDILSSEVEHMVASSHVKAGVGSADQPRNLLWAAPNGNNSKASSGDSFLEWGRALREIQKGGREKYNKEKYEPALEKVKASKGRKEAAPTELAKAFSLQSPQERKAALRQLMKAYGGEEVRYLLRAVGMKSGEWDVQIPQKGRPNRVVLDNGATLVFNGKKYKPSEAVLLTSSYLNPEQRKVFLERVDALRVARQIDKNEVNNFESTKDPGYVELRRKLDRDFERNMESLIRETVSDSSTLD